MATKLLDIDTPIVSLSAARRFITECMAAAGTPRKFASILADNLVESDYGGHYTHGMSRLDFYVKDVQSGHCAGKAAPCIIKESAATAWVDGNNGLGAVVGQFSMEVAIEKAKQIGVGMVVAKQSNHFGMARTYTLQALKHNLLGMSFSNTAPVMAPTRSKAPALGTNPFSMAAPACDQDSFVLDMATTAVALGKIHFQKQKREPIPEGWALDTAGNMTTDADAASDAQMLMPLGGPEIQAGYKGYGLAMLVEVLSGVLGGSSHAPNIPRWGDFDKKADWAHCFIAVDTGCFAPGFQGRLSDLMGFLRNMEPADPAKPVLVAGDRERMHMAEVDRAGGVRYLKDQHETCRKLAQALNVEPLIKINC